MIETEISNVLAQIRANQHRIDQPLSPNQAAAPATAESGFGQLVKHAIDQVSEQQEISSQMIERFQAGDENTSIAEVVVQMQKASISFQAMAEARNRIIEAYREIMSMSV